MTHHTTDFKFFTLLNQFRNGNFVFHNDFDKRTKTWKIELLEERDLPEQKKCTAVKKLKNQTKQKKNHHKLIPKFYGNPSQKSLIIYC